MPKQISDLVQQLISCSQDTAWQQLLTKKWPLIIGNLGDKVRLEKTVGTTVILGVYDTCWMQELYLLTPKIIKKLNAALPAPVITSIRLTYVNKQIYHPPTQPCTHEMVSQPLPSLSKEEKKAINSIGDQELAQALLQFLRRCNAKT